MQPAVRGGGRSCWETFCFCFVLFHPPACVFVRMTSGCTSSFRPELFPACIRNAATVVKPGGYVLFRDYGLYDHAQLRFKAGCVDGWLASIFFICQHPASSLSLSCSLPVATTRRLPPRAARNTLVYTGKLARNSEGQDEAECCP